MVTIYKPEHILSFGKNKGYDLETVYKYQPSYIEWAILTIDDFCIDISSFTQLDTPITHWYDSQAFNPKHILHKRSLEFNIENLMVFTKNNDGINGMLKVADVIEMVKNDPTIIKTLEDFNFPQHIITINEYKILNYLRRKE